MPGMCFFSNAFFTLFLVPVYINSEKKFKHEFAGVPPNPSHHQALAYHQHRVFKPIKNLNPIPSIILFLPW
jgi:hypothetical protein